MCHNTCFLKPEAEMSRCLRELEVMKLSFIICEILKNTKTLIAMSIDDFGYKRRSVESAKKIVLHTNDDENVDSNNSGDATTSVHQEEAR